MFARCPHCQFLIALHPRTRALPEACPRCGEPLADDAAANASPASLATYLRPAPSDEGHEAAPDSVHAREDRTAIDAPADVDASASRAPASDAATTIAQATATRDDDATGVAPDDDDADAAASSDAASPAPLAPTNATPTSTTTTTRRHATGPRFLHRARTMPVHARSARWQWIAVIALSALLCVQAVLADRARLASHAAWRPVVLALCGVFRCDVPTWREPTAFAMLSRDVRPAPGVPGVLQAQATFRNEARWAQAWPVILLTLKDADGRTLGARALQPGDYLAEGEPSSAIGPGQSAQVAVLVREPSANVVAFSFDFR